MEKKSSLLAFVFLAVLATGCGSIRVVSEARSGGTIVLDGAHGASRAKAEKYMRQQCPAGYEVVEEGDTVGDSDDTREWRIAYRCNGSPSVAMIAY